MRTGVVIGGGIGGLVSAIQLAARGVKVTLFEKEKSLGGKFRSIRLGDYFFNISPSPSVMPWIFERVFQEAGAWIDPSLQFIPLSIGSRHFFYNKTIVDLSADPDYMMEQLAALSSEDRQGFLDYLVEVQRMYEWVEETVLKNSQMCWYKLFSPKKLRSFLSVHPFETLDSFHRRFFTDPRLIAMMNRYAGYTGSSPYEAPALLAVLAYLEIVQGAFYVEGGNERLIESLERLARSLSVSICTDCPVEEILVSGRQVAGVRAGKEKYSANLVVSGMDVMLTQTELLSCERKTANSYPLSCSAFFCLFGVKCLFPFLAHHNYFYPRDSGRHFIDLFEQKEWPGSPVIYVGNSSVSEPNRAAGGSNLCVMVQVPAGEPNGLSPAVRDGQTYRDQLVYLLEQVWGLEGLSENVEVEKWLGPADIEEITRATGGTLFGTAIHGWRSFARPPLRDKNISGLYYLGSAAYPVDSLSMSVLSGLHAAEMIEQDWVKEMQAKAVN